MPKLSYEDMIARRIDLSAEKPATSKAELQTIEAVRAYTAGILTSIRPLALATKRGFGRVSRKSATCFIGTDTIATAQGTK